MAIGRGNWGIWYAEFRPSFGVRIPTITEPLIFGDKVIDISTTSERKHVRPCINLLLADLYQPVLPGIRTLGTLACLSAVLAGLSPRALYLSGVAPTAAVWDESVRGFTGARNVSLLRR